MLLFLENCMPASYENDLDRMDALSNILKSHGRRNNILVAKKNVVREILNSKFYSSNDKCYANDSLSTSREYSILKSKLLVYGVVDFEDDVTSVDYINGAYRVKVGYKYFVEENSGATPVITENSTDFDFYSFIGDFYAKYISKLGVKVKLTPNLGAGSHSRVQFDTLSKLHPFLLCIVDNDKAHPLKSEGSTSSAFKHKERSYNSGNVVKVIDVREIESLIPKFILKDSLGSGLAKVVDSLNELLELSSLSKEFRVYFDHKDGMSLQTAIELDNKYGEFWLPILGKINRFKSKPCFRTKKCTDCGSCPTLEGLGKSLLKTANQSICLINKHKFKTHLEDDLKEYWDDIGYTIMSWGCTPSTKLARA